MDETNHNPYFGDYAKPGKVYEEGEKNLKSPKTLATNEEIINSLKQVYDPEIPVNIYDLGLIYKIDIDKFNNLDITMTLTTPNCPVAGILPIEIGNAAMSVEQISRVRVYLTFDPPWDMSHLSEAAKMALNI